MPPPELPALPELLLPPDVDAEGSCASRDGDVAQAVKSSTEIKISARMSMTFRFASRKRPGRHPYSVRVGHNCACPGFQTAAELWKPFAPTVGG
jgi:hypothetical protein